MRYLKFVSEFIKNPKQVGAVAESSGFLARKMAGQIGGAVNVVEFGPGTGAVTREILRKLPVNGTLTCLEINPKFCEDLQKIDDHRLKVVNDDVRNYSRHIENYDCVLSSLPLAIFEKAQRDKIIAISGRSKKFVQFQYTPFLKPKLKKYFDDVEIKFVPLNLPPAFVYVSENPRSKTGSSTARVRKNKRSFAVKAAIQFAMFAANFWTSILK
ncbi:MAG: 16S ribosomal RNA methyltransferase KsgA/Dim1 family protein [Planctomycetes bacterium ADurb.Bin401]|nr:MAG: 16S ribosomal RNA methyltransferase KsgA/Dim1 family protein [Planctomycetes bacterium ADurb.Bin401]